MDKTQIKACPFCGKPATVEIRTLKEKEYYLIGCENLACRGSAWAGYPGAVRAMSRWNERAGGRKPEPSADASDKHIALQGLVRLLESATRLNEIVEGIRNERWAANGKRLKDTPEWCDFYCKLKAANQQPNCKT